MFQSGSSLITKFLPVKLQTRSVYRNQEDVNMVGMVSMYSSEYFERDWEKPLNSCTLFMNRCIHCTCTFMEEKQVFKTHILIMVLEFDDFFFNVLKYLLCVFQFHFLSNL